MSAAAAFDSKGRTNRGRRCGSLRRDPRRPGGGEHRRNKPQRPHRNKPQQGHQDAACCGAMRRVSGHAPRVREGTAPRKPRGRARRLLRLLRRVAVRFRARNRDRDRTEEAEGQGAAHVDRLAGHLAHRRHCRQNAILLRTIAGYCGFLRPFRLRASCCAACCNLLGMSAPYWNGRMGAQVCVRASERASVRLRVCVRARVCGVRMYGACASVRVRACVRIRACVRACVRAHSCAHARVKRVCFVPVCVCVRARACARASMCARTSRRWRRGRR